MSSISIELGDINKPDAIQLIHELSTVLEGITGSSGKNSFNLDEMVSPRSIFVLARAEGKAVGCAAIRPLDEKTGEMKRMYAKEKGVGAKLLAFIEGQAKRLDYSTIVLETRMINQQAVRFYEKHGYTRIENYGKYIGRTEAICFEKKI